MMNQGGQERIAVIGLGYVGLPLAMAFARRFDDVCGYDADPRRIAELRAGTDKTGEVTRGALSGSSLKITGDVEALDRATVLIVAVPTPIDANKQPDLSHLKSASETVGRAIGKAAGSEQTPVLVVYESTVFPGATEEVCLPIIETCSAGTLGQTFQLAYSPERINPGDPHHSLENVVKVVSGSDEETLKRATALYASIIGAGIHQAPSIRVAEAAKVIENTQRDLNIALMNELAIIFDRMNIPTGEVLAAAGTKWNFLRFHPGLVGGHCIGVDPYYLTAKAKTMGYHPEVILAGRRINDGMGRWVAQRTVKLLIQSGLNVAGSRVAVLGLTYKANVPDLRNSRVPDVLDELRDFGVKTLCHDAVADPDLVRNELGVAMTPLAEMQDLDGIVLAVPHAAYLEGVIGRLAAESLRPGGVMVDLMGALDAPSMLPESLIYWAL